MSIGSKSSSNMGSKNQWPRWEVFKQDSATKVHQAVGSVHAVDAEHALLTARSVFARRPSAVSMWVVNADDIAAYTQEMLQTDSIDNVELGEKQVFSIFAKTSNKRSMTFVNHVDQVEATSTLEALKLAETLPALTETEVLAWWIIPNNCLTKTDESSETIESWFEPSKDKTYKQQSSYGQVGNRPARAKRKTT